MPITLLITAAIFALTASPTFLWLRERASPSPVPEGHSYARSGFDRLRRTLSQAVHFRALFRFLICLLVYQSGVATVTVLAAIYAREVMGFDSQQLVLLIMLANLTAAIGAFLFGHAQDRFGSIPTLAVALLIWIAAVLMTFFADRSVDLWIAGNLIGLSMGASQAGSRALIGQFTPAARSGEFFGLWGLTNRLAAILGPLSYGVISYASGGNHRLAILSTLVFFIVGLILLVRVNEKDGKAAALKDPTSERPA